MDKNSWMIIVNPKAGRGRGLQDWPILSNELNMAGVAFSCVFSVHKYHAIELTIKAIKEGYRHLAALGGDGTVHEVVNAVFMQKEVEPGAVTLAIFPLGCGNDYVRNLNLGPSYKEWVRHLAAGRTRCVDIAAVHYREAQVDHIRYIVNSMGIGMDAQVIRYYNRFREKNPENNGRRSQYIWSVFKGFFFCTFHEIEVKADSVLLYRGNIYSLCAGKGRYKGNGLLMLPSAGLENGLIDLSVVEKVSKWKAFRFVMALKKGLHTRQPFCHYARARRIEISLVAPDRDPQNAVRMEVDGELLGNPPYMLEIMPGALRLIDGNPPAGEGN